MSSEWGGGRAGAGRKANVEDPGESRTFRQRKSFWIAFDRITAEEGFESQAETLRALVDGWHKPLPDQEKVEN